MGGHRVKDTGGGGGGLKDGWQGLMNGGEWGRATRLASHSRAEVGKHSHPSK